MMRDNTIGVVDWQRLRTAHDGERFLVIISAFFQPQHVPYLEAILKSRVAAIDDRASVSLNHGQLTEMSSRTHYDPGTIVLPDVAAPWPDAAELRASLDAAFVEAGEIEGEQRKLAIELEKHLRSAQPPS